MNKINIELWKEYVVLHSIKHRGSVSDITMPINEIEEIFFRLKSLGYIVNDKVSIKGEKRLNLDYELLNLNPFSANIYPIFDDLILPR